MKERCYSSLDTHSQNRTFRASLLTANKFARNFVLFMNGRPLRPADLDKFLCKHEICPDLAGRVNC